MKGLTLYVASLIILFSILLPARAFSDEDIEDRKILNIEVESRTGITAPEIVSITGIKAGEPYSARKIRKGIELLFKKGIFSDIIVDAVDKEDGVVLKFILKEKVLISDIRIEENAIISTKEISGLIKIKKGDEYSRRKTEETAEIIGNYYRQKGFFKAEVEAETIQEKTPDRVSVVFKIAEGFRAKVAKIEFTGNKAYSDLTLSNIVKVWKDLPYDEIQLDKDIKALEEFYIKEGYIRSVISPKRVYYDEDNNEVSIILHIEAGIHVIVSFKGNTEVFSGELKKELLIYEDRSYEEDILDGSVKKMQSLYRSKGFYLVKIDYELKEFLEKNEVALTFSINEGNKVFINKISIKGNESIKTKKIKKIMNTKKAGIFSRGILKDDVIAKDMESIAALYRQNGFTEAKVLEPEVILSEDRTEMEVVIAIAEGPKTTIDKIIIKGNTVYPTEEIIKAMKGKEGMPYIEAQANDDKYNILALYSKKGYLYANVVMKRFFKEDKKLIELVYTITEDKPVNIGRIYLTGNLLTRDKVVYRELLFHSDEPYDYEKILKTQRRLYSLGIFGEVKIDPIEEPKKEGAEIKEYTKDIQISVKERNAGAVEFGVGFGDVDRLRGFVEVSHKNIWGYNRQANVRAEASAVEKKLSVGFKDPWLFNYRMDGRAGAGYQIEENVGYSVRRLSLTAGIDKGFTEYIKGSLFYQYEDVELYNVKPDAILAPEDQGHIAISSLNPSIIIDTRDNPFNPARGFIAGLSVKNAANYLGSEAEFIKMSLQTSWYYSPIKRTVLALSARGGIGKAFGDSVEMPISERFMAGGRTTVRGYQQNFLGPKGNDGTPTGGNAMLILNAELRFNLPYNIGLVFFVDGGNVWLTYEKFRFKDLKYTTGAGIRYNTPIGPLRLDYGYKLDREVGEDVGEWHFTLGHAF
ncbi:MAG: outer membrane protein assembly factor BamA [Nitrospirae bacterium]|nr:outer membrane protein assembly factor BamA [Nitrospirota bacterium]